MQNEKRTALKLWERAQDPTERGLGMVLFRLVLSFLALLYGLGVRLRNIVYDTGLLRTHKLSGFVISVGNLTVGGTGKTPVVIHLAQRSAAKGRKVAVLTRGYAREGQEPFRVVKVNDSAREVGDEPLMMARRLDPIPVVVGKDRVRSGSWAIKNLGVDTLLLDDGFQYRKLKKDVEIVLLDATNPFGNRRLLPRGILREPASSLQRADGVLLTKIEQCEITNSKSELEERLRRLHPRAAIARIAYVPKQLKRLGKEEALDVSELAGKAVAAFSGLASPASFRRTLEGLNARVILEKRFPDHHYYTDDEVRRLVVEAQQAGAWGLVTTEKDAVRIPPITDSALPIWILTLEIDVRSGSADLETLLRLR
jgi:tetraacyldisaccharide 4'-kinase